MRNQLLKWILLPLRRLRKNEDGNATIEFVMVFPMVFILFLSSFETGLMMIRQVVLERAVDTTVRELRLGYIPSPTQEKLRNIICKRAALISSECRDTLLIELRPVSTVTWEPLSSDTTCKNRNTTIHPTPPDDFVKAGSSNEMVLVRVCAIIKPLFPTTKMGMALNRDGLGGYALVASSAFVNEPR